MPPFHIESVQYADLSPLFLLAEFGAERGGHDRWGSMIWADVAEMELTEPLPGTYQIFGHTLDREPIITNDWACLDCAQTFVLDTDAGTVTAQ